MKSLTHYYLIGGALLFGSLTGACTDGDVGKAEPHLGGSSSGDGDGDQPMGDGDGEMPDDQAVYAIVTQVFDGESFTSYIVTTPSLSMPLGVEDGIEISGRALGAGLSESGRLYIATDQSATITRYDLQQNGDLKKHKDELSFGPAGPSGIGEYAGQFHFVSDDKAYFFDGTTGNVIVWNPREMLYQKALSLAELLFDGELLTFGAVPVRHGDDVLMFPGWRTTDNAKVPARAAVVTVDTKTDDVSVIFDDRCGYVRDGFLADDGYVYMATEAFASAAYYYDDKAANAPCLIRFDPESGEFDQDFFIDISKWGVDSAGTLLVGADNQPYLLGLDADGYTGMVHPRFLASAAQWHFLRLSLGDEPSVEPLDLAPTPGSILPAYLGDEVLFPLFSGRDATTLTLWSADGPKDGAETITGLAFSTVKLK